MFLSSYENSLDNKGRISVPAHFRAALKGDDLLYVWASFEGEYLEGGGLALLESYRLSLRQLSLHDETRIAMAHAIFARIQPLKLESNGRVTLPAELIAHARLEDGALFVGLDDRFQIWQPQGYQRQARVFHKRANDNKAMLSALPEKERVSNDA